jgi:TusA-related sulfurtransferase
VIDFQGFCDTTAHALIAQSEADGVYTFCIEKGA